MPGSRVGPRRVCGDPGPGSGPAGDRGHERPAVDQPRRGQHPGGVGAPGAGRPERSQHRDRPRGAGPPHQHPSPRHPVQRGAEPGGPGRRPGLRAGGRVDPGGRPPASRPADRTHHQDLRPPVRQRRRGGEGPGGDLQGGPGLRLREPGDREGAAVGDRGGGRDRPGPRRAARAGHVRGPAGGGEHHRPEGAGDRLGEDHQVDPGDHRDQPRRFPERRQSRASSPSSSTTRPATSTARWSPSR